MNRPTLFLLSTAAASLIVLAAFVVIQSRDASIAGHDARSSQGFVHPPVSMPVSDQMLRAQAPEPAARSSSVGGARPANAVQPSADNVNGRYFEEIFILEQRLAIQPDDTTSLAKLGRLHQAGHAFTEAEAAYTAYLTLRTEGRQVWIDLTAVHAGQEDWEAARQTLGDMLERFPGDEAALYNLGALSANAGQFEDALKQWRSLLESTQDASLAERLRLNLMRLEGMMG